jgi:hypothetical protein
MILLLEGKGERREENWKEWKGVVLIGATLRSS